MSNTKSALASLTQDILIIILSYLRIEDVLHIRSVSQPTHRFSLLL
jgi:hypothetical protein